MSDIKRPTPSQEDREATAALVAALAGLSIGPMWAPVIDAAFMRHRIRVVEQERSRCARIATQIAAAESVDHTCSHGQHAALNIAAAIREGK